MASKGHSWAGIRGVDVRARVVGPAHHGVRAGGEAAPRRRVSFVPTTTRPSKGKTIAFLPIALGVPLQDEWGRVVQDEADWRGMKYVVRDPNQQSVGDAAGADRAGRSTSRTC